MAVKAALQEVDTPLVCIHQHDLEFCFNFRWESQCLDKVLDILEDPSNPVKYVGLPLLVNLHYEGIAFQHHGIKVHCAERHRTKFMFESDGTRCTRQVKPQVFQEISLMPNLAALEQCHHQSQFR
eukprot:Skav220171  [mRNA]  locus=scaffold564:497564:499036:+ [translate_table: standard]